MCGGGGVNSVCGGSTMCGVCEQCVGFIYSRLVWPL